jgi:cysteine desulfurase
MTTKYFDYNATTPLDPRVHAAMNECYLGPPGNAGSRTHVFGQRAKEAVENARQQVATVLGAQPEEILFTSGATESDNLVVLGLAAFGERTGRRHIISTAIEHKAVLEPLAAMRRLGFEVDLAPVTSGGYVEPDAIRKRLRRDTLLVSVMHANNETGVLQPVREIAEAMAATDTLFHTDAAQTFGKEVDDLRRLQCDLLSISGHKIYGPQGIGAIAIRRRGSKGPLLEPLMFGGGQERGVRPGTLPVALIVGLGKAAQLAQQEHTARRFAAERVKAQLIADLQKVEHHVNGDPSCCQPHVLNVSFPGVDSEALMMALRDELAVSNGAACTSDRYGSSHVLEAMGLTPERIASAIRISWGPGAAVVPTGVLRDAILRLR